MPRIGRKPIPVPAGVKIALQAGQVDVQGPKGKLTVPVPYGITFEQKDGVLNALRATEEHRALHGLARALVANAVHGVTLGFKKELDIVGVGYRAELKGKAVAFALGKSHPIEFKIPEGIQISVEKQTHLVVSGASSALRRTASSTVSSMATERVISSPPWTTRWPTPSISSMLLRTPILGSTRASRTIFIPAVWLGAATSFSILSPLEA
jgi:large subunit ribosomal protein L6